MNSLSFWNTRPPYLSPEKPVCRSKKQQLEPDMEQRTGSKLGKEYVEAVYCHPAYLTSTQSTLCKMLGWMKHKLESRLPGEISITSDTQMKPPYGRKQRRTKEPLDESESGEWKIWLKAQHSENKDHGIWSHHFMGNRWGNSGNSVRLYFWGAPKSLQMVIAAMKLKDFILGGSKITADGDCSQ